MSTSTPLRIQSILAFLLVFASSLPAQRASGVSLTAFSAQAEGMAIKLEWSVVNEGSIAYYEVLHGIADSFSRIARVDALGDSSATYTLTDYSPLQGLNQYQLVAVSRKQVRTLMGFSSALTYSTVASVNVYPNPTTTGTVSVDLPLTEAGWTLTVISLNGQKMLDMAVPATWERVHLPQQLGTGLYRLILHSGPTVITKELVVTR